MKDDTERDDTQGSEDAVYDEGVERQWSEAASIEGIDPDLLAARPSGVGNDAARVRGAAFSPWLIPYGAFMAGPLVAGLLTLLTDGDPPRPRQAIAIIAAAATAWVLNVGLSTLEAPLISPRGDAAAHLAVLFVSGAVLWALYRFWIRGKRALDQRGVINTGVVFIVLSAIFWIGRDSTWLVWLGR